MHNASQHIAARKKEGLPTTFFDRFMLVVGVAVGFLTVPQILSVWQHGAEGVSLLSWIGYTAHSTLWMIYGIAHREWTIIWVNALWAVMNGLVVVAVLATR